MLDFLFDEGRDDEAMRLAEEVRTRSPDAPEPFVVIGSHARKEHAWEAARDNFLRAEELAARDPAQHVQTLMRVALEGLMVPGQRARSTRLLLTYADNVRDPAPHLFLAVLLEQDDPDSAARHVAAAKLLWRGDDDSFLIEKERIRYVLAE